MAWYENGVFYHIYPLGLTGAPEQNSYEAGEHRLLHLLPWISHIRDLGCNALYIGPLFESVGHGYETTDYRKLDSRLGDNGDLKEFVQKCHEAGIRVILDGVFNHTGRDFFAFRDLLKNRENSPYKDWYKNVNFGGNNEYQDGFSYDNWGGFNLLAKLNLQNPQVRDYLLETVDFWIEEFDIDGLRLDAADVLDFGFMQALRKRTQQKREDFWLMGEVIHGDYSRWVNDAALHSVTDYALHKALYSGHNDYNYFEIAHTVKYISGMGPIMDKLYSFTDNHDVARIYSKLQNKEHFPLVHILLYTLPGIPSIYYGSEYAIPGEKERYSDASLRPALNLEELKKGPDPYSKLFSLLGRLRQTNPVLSGGAYRELLLTNRQYAFAREKAGEQMIIALNCDEKTASLALPGEGNFMEAFTGEEKESKGGILALELEGCQGQIWIKGR